MKLAFVDLSGFRGYRKRVRIEFSDGYTIIDGRNGAGKSTIFDAVEFALTGTISKYLDAKASGQSVNDYLWWSGEANAPADSYVEVGFREGEELFSLRRTPMDPGGLEIGHVASKLFDSELAPANPLAQLCAASIIRDEHIARLSLDLKEADRFALLRDALGAVDADVWITKASSLVSAAGMKVKNALAELEQANLGLSSSIRQIDQTRSALPATSLLSQATARLQQSLRSHAPADQLGDVARRRLAEIGSSLDIILDLASLLPDVVHARDSLPLLEKQLVAANAAWEHAKDDLDKRVADLSDMPKSTELSLQARQLENLVSLGRNLGMRDGHCPLCDSDISHSQFEHGLKVALTVARQIDARSVEQAAKERLQDEARVHLGNTAIARDTAVRNRDAALAIVREFDLRLNVADLSGASQDDLTKRTAALEAERTSITSDLRLLDTISINQVLARATEDQRNAKERVARAEARLGKARLAEMRAKVIHDAARRAAAETLDQRLDRVLPLMSELYKRLRPHPMWGDIEYSVRGDVKRFLRLQVGENVNPQFVFSSGQRRATGLAFLLSINLSVAWSRWRSVLLDDPVQHVDDFRTVHLTEVLAHLCQGGRQIICSVEDSALADLMCRRLPTSDLVPGARITLGNDSDGAISIIRDETIAPLGRRSLVQQDDSLSA